MYDEPVAPGTAGQFEPVALPPSVPQRTHWYENDVIAVLLDQPPLVVFSVCPATGEPETTRLPPPARTVVPRKLAGEPAGECQRIRRKFWLEDQGWVVRAVSRC